MSNVRCWQVNAFTSRPFHGNPAAVCWLEQDVPDRWMQAVAAEMNLSETAFVRKTDNGLQLRWFTPTVEVDLCGHATLATIHALTTAGLVSSSEPIQFQTRSGTLTCQRRGALIELNFPALPAEETAHDARLLEAMGITAPVYFGKNRFDAIVVVSSPAEVRSVQPDFRRLGHLPYRGVIVTAQSDDPRYDFESRFFAPAVGVDEDPVCGSAHCCLTPFWSQRLQKTKLTAWQASARGGHLQLRLEGDRVVLGGEAVVVWQGELMAGP